MAKKYMTRRRPITSERDDFEFFKVNDNMLENMKPAVSSEPPWGIIKAKRKQRERQEEYYQDQLDEIREMFP